MIQVERDVIRRNIHRFSVLDGEPEMIIASDFANTKLHSERIPFDKDNIIFHEALSRSVKNRFPDKQYFFPLVVSIKTTQDGNGINALKSLQKMAYERQDKWLVVLPVDSTDNDIDQ